MILFAVTTLHRGPLCNHHSAPHIRLILNDVSVLVVLSFGGSLRQTRHQNIRSAKEIEMQIYHLLCDPKLPRVHHSRATVIVTDGFCQ